MYLYYRIKEPGPKKSRKSNKKKLHDFFSSNKWSYMKYIGRCFSVQRLLTCKCICIYYECRGEDAQM